MGYKGPAALAGLSTLSIGMGFGLIAHQAHDPSQLGGFAQPPPGNIGGGLLGLGFTGWATSIGWAMSQRD